MIWRRDTPEEIEQLHAAGWTRSSEIDGLGMWHAPGTGFEVSGATAALAHQAALEAQQQEASQ